MLNLKGQGGITTLSKVLFHVVFWSAFLGLPILSAGDERFRHYQMQLLPISILLVPLFFINTQVLINRILKKNGYGLYVLSLTLLAGLFFFLSYFGRKIILEPRMWERQNIWFILFPILFVAAVSTGYGLIIYLIEQEKDRRQEHEERMKSELSFLRSQISPHFIFNILNSIVYLIRSKSDMAEQVTIKLSEIMRYMLYYTPSDQVLLSQELEYVDNYIELQKIRFEEDVKIDLAIHGNPGQQRIEPMLIIPFIENAFKHGVGLIMDPFIDVRIDIDGSSFYLTVRNKKSTIDTKDKASGIGLPNVRRRLELLYPDKHTLKVEEDDRYFQIMLNLELSSSVEPTLAIAHV